MPMSEHYHDSKRRKKRISLLRRLPVIFWFILVGCPALCYLAYAMGFRLVPIK